MMKVFNIGLIVLMGWFANLLVVFLAILALNIFVIGGFTLYHWLELQH